MALIDKLNDIFIRLAPHGWLELFQAHGLDIKADDLAGELARALPDIDRGLKGFSDLSPLCTRGIQAGSVARSLIYHAFASPIVTHSPAGALTAFPTLAEIEVVENYVFASAQRTLANVREIARQLSSDAGGDGSGSLAVVLMTSEYRNREETVHGLHADMAYARTGVARAGTAAPLYNGDSRGHWPASNGKNICVIPCAWSAYICTRLPVSEDGLLDPSGFGPITPVQDDLGQDFWVPLHKVFDGPECLVAQDLNVQWQAHHENSKIAKIHKFFDFMDEPSAVDDADLGAAPYRFSDNIAELSGGADLPAGTVVPVPSAAMVAIARDGEGNPVSFNVPRRKELTRGSIRLFGGASSLELRTPDDNRPVPEYLHIRHKIDDSGNVRSLNEDKAMMQEIRAGNFQAVHYVDFTGAGFVSISLDGLSEDLEVKPGFSVVSAPDFYPMVDQQKVMAWYRDVQAREPAIAHNIGWGAPPRPLSTVRLVADPNIANGGQAPFGREHDDGTEHTICAIVAAPGESRGEALPSTAQDVMRCSVLPDAAAGIFAPGWGISRDSTNNVQHLSAYGLGSPFPEDSKLCAALSAFWPAAAPDTTRTYNPNGRSTAPMVDSEMVGEGAWDGIDGVVFDAARSAINFPDNAFADYVESALKNDFDIRATANVTMEAYVGRVYRTAQVRHYINQNASLGIGNFALMSFTEIADGDAVFDEISTQAGVTIAGPAYRFVIGVLGQTRRLPDDHRRRRATARRVLEFVAGEDIVVHREGGFWKQNASEPLLV